MWQGAKLYGQAEALDFHLFPTERRLDASADAAKGRHVTAWVDPAQPFYAIAFISDDFFVPQSMQPGMIFWLCFGSFVAWGGMMPHTTR